MPTRILLFFAFALNLIALRLHASDTNVTIGYCTADFAAAKTAGFDYAEVRIREFMKLSDADFATFSVNCRSNGLPLTTAYWFLPNDLKVAGPDVNLNVVTNYFIKAFDRCQRLGVKFIVWGSGESRRVPENFPRAQAFDQLVALAKLIAPAAQKHGITIVVEPLRKQESNVINSAAEGLRWVEAVGHPNFELLVDIFHLTEEKEDPAIIIKAGAHIKHIHMANPRGRIFPLSAEEFDYAPFFNALNQIGYHGTMSIEAKASDLATEGPLAIQFIRTAYAADRSSKKSSRPK